MAIRIQLRRDTAANWTSANPVLLAGELGVETDTLKIKIGNGLNWNSITSYANTTPANLDSTLSDYVLVADMGQPDGVATLDSTGKIPVEQLGHLIDSAPGVLDTLNEIAAAINDDENFATTMTTLINNTGTTAATDATNKANDAVTTAAAYTDNEIDVLHSVLTGEISTHNSDTTNVHGITDTAELSTKTYANAAVSTHNAATTNIHGIADTAELATITHVDNVLSTHESSTTGIHGIADTAELATKTYANSAASAVQAQLANYAAKAGATFTGDVTIPDLNVTNVIIDGDLTVNGTTTTVSSQNLEVTDPLIYIGTGNSANSKDLGLVGHFDNGTYQHTGIVRDATDGKWKVFSGVTTEPSDIIDFSTYTKDTVVVGALEADSAIIGDVTNTELQYVHGVTSAIQDQIDDKAPIDSPVFTGNAAFPAQVRVSSTGSYVFSDGSATSPSSGSVALKRKSDGSGLTVNAFGTDNDIAVVNNPTFTGIVTVSSSGIAFTDGTQAKQGVPSITPIISKTSDYTLSSLSERDSMIEVDSTSPVTIKIPTNSAVPFPIGASLDVMGINTGLITIEGDSGVTVNATPGLKLRTQWSSVTLFKRGTDSWVVYGDLKA